MDKLPDGTIYMSEDNRTGVQFLCKVIDGHPTRLAMLLVPAETFRKVFNLVVYDAPPEPMTIHEEDSDELPPHVGWPLPPSPGWPLPEGPKS